ncbi:TonB-dependent receptor [Caulobacter sp. D4A]|nr:TonB-dependent receptor [Caulobacter sp. D4A]PXA95647.1 TonB-dependent receptor [Caulobacter sp. D5]
MRTTRIRMAGWMGGASVAVLLSAAPALAQETVSTAPAASQASPSDTVEDNAVETVIVTGQRAALKSAQQIKRDADTIVDSITANDIGAFPDKSVAEALQRVPGITVNRYASTSDTTHFSAEPSGVIVRGLSQVRSEFNGRDTFSANSSRGLSWGDVSPELMGGVDTYKNQTAELIEGGIAGSINLRTRLPFDSAGRTIGLTTSLNYGTLSEQLTPEISGIYSNRWDTEIGEFGLMVNGSHSELNTISESAQYGRMGVFEDTAAYGAGKKYIPSWYRLAHTEFDRTRNGISAAGQWQDHDHKFLATVQYNKSSYENIWNERSVQGSAFSLYAKDPRLVIGTASDLLKPAAGTKFTFDDEGNFESGIMTSPLGWVGNITSASPDWAGYLVGQTSTGQPIIEPCYGWTNRTDCVAEQRGAEISTDTRYNYNRQSTQDLSFNLKWEATERLRFNFDVQKVDATVHNYDADVGMVAYGDMQLDATGDHPKMTILPGTNINYAAGGLGNPNAWRFNNVNNHIEDSEGEQLALRFDVNYDLGDGWLNTLKVGARYADREQTVRWSAYNWGGIANAWGCDNNGTTSTDYLWYNADRTSPAASVNGDCNGDTTSSPNTAFSGWSPNLTDVRSFNNIFDGNVLSSGLLTFTSMDVVKDLAALQKAFGYANTGVGSSKWNAVCYRAGETNCYLPEEIADVEEKTQAVYAMLKFGGGDHTVFGFPVSGNLGVRYVETKNASNGATIYADMSTLTSQTCLPTTPPTDPITGLPLNIPYLPQTMGCYVSADDFKFASGGGTTGSAKAKHHNLLPSLNVKFDLNDEWQLRLAISRAMSRPDIGYMKKYLKISATLPDSDNLNDPQWIKNSAGVITGANVIYTADAYNPYLKPMTADQIDISLEHYFSEVGSLTVALFYKKFNDYIQYGGFYQDVTNNGVTRSVFTRGPMNGDGAKIRGAEVAYQRYFDFLPAPFDGLGVQANFTYLENKGVKNQNLTNASGSGSSNTSGGGFSQSGGAIRVDSLEGLSKYSYNVVGMYEKGRWALRAAYNWRSKYLLTAMDCCLLYPIWQDDAGYLDASIRYRATDNLEISLQGSNLLNTESVLKQQVTDADLGGLLKDNAWNRTDQRYLLTFRFKY